MSGDGVPGHGVRGSNHSLHRIDAPRSHSSSLRPSDVHVPLRRSVDSIDVMTVHEVSSMGLKGIGAALGTAALSIDAVYVSFVAFGVVALLSLVCNELLIEAKAAQGNDERW